MKHILFVAALMTLAGAAHHYISVSHQADAAAAFSRSWAADQDAAGDASYRMTLRNQADAARLKAARESK